MRAKTLVAFVAGRLIVGLAGLAQGQSVTRVTGGGQYFTDGVGADDTLTFQVQQSDSGQTFGEVEFDPTKVWPLSLCCTWNVRVSSAPTPSVKY